MKPRRRRRTRGRRLQCARALRSRRAPGRRLARASGLPRRALAGARGQASVELVALVPVLVLVVAAVVQVLAAGTAHERASAAAEAGAVAMLQDVDPKAAVEAALGPAVARAKYVIDGRRVRVTVQPRTLAGPLAELLAATSEADAGGEADAVARTVVRGGDGEGSRPRARFEAGR